MAQLMDQSLDDIIRQSDSQTRGRYRGGGRGTGRGRRGGSSSSYRGGGGRRTSGGDYSYGPIRRQSGGGRSYTDPYPSSSSSSSRAMDVDVWDHDMYHDDQNGGTDYRTGGGIQSRLGDSGPGTKVVIRNLRETVTTADIQELFGEIGALKRVEVEYDRAGRSTGSAVAVFLRRKDAETAVSKYNGVSLDNQPMEIFIVEGGPRRRRVSGGAPSASGMRIGTSADGRRRVVIDQFDGDDDDDGFSSTRRGRSYGGRGRGRGRGGGRGRGRGRGDRRTPTKEELDNELASLTSQQLQSMDINT